MKVIERHLAGGAEFLGSEHYMGKLAGTLYSYWVSLFLDLFDQDGCGWTVVLDGAVGTGKSLFCQAVGLRVLYEILEAGGARAYDLADGEWLHVVLCRQHSVSQLGSVLNDANYFRHQWSCPPAKIEFVAARVRVIEALPDDLALLGMNVAAIIADGLNEMEDAKATRTVCRSLRRRMRSRLCVGDLPGLLLYSGAGFSTTGLLAADGVDHRRRPATWDTHPKRCAPGRFRVAVPANGKKPYFVTEQDALVTGAEARIIEVPEDYRTEFERDITGALRDLAGVPCGQ